jgi:Chaperone of endosialidase
MGGKTGTTTQSVQIPPEVLARYNSVNAQAQSTAAQPFQQYSTDPNAFVAPLNQQQLTGISNINQQAMAAQPAYSAAMQGTSQAYGGLSPQGFQQGVAGYMNPFVNQAMGATAAQLQNVNQQQQQQLLGQGISQGAFGGDRGKIAQSALMNQQNLALGNTLSNMAQQGYQSAAQNYLTGIGQQGALANQMGALGAGAQAAGLQGAQAQLGAGTLGQQTQQAGNTALYNQFLQQQAYPFQVAQFLANIAEGTGALSGSTTTTQQPMPFFSDRRLKHDIKRIGESDSGLPIYAFKYKHDPEGHTHVGFMADEVEHVHPEAVGLAGGYKTVDYDKIANDNGRAEGGAVLPQHAGLGFMAGGREHHAYGSAVGSDYNPYDPNNIQNIVARQQAAFNVGENNFVPAARQISGGLGKHSRVPEANLPVGALHTAGPIPQTQQSMLDQGIGAAERGQKIAELFQAAKEKFSPSASSQNPPANKQQNPDQNASQNPPPATSSSPPTPPAKTSDAGVSAAPLPPMDQKGLASADFAPGDDLTAATGGRMHRALGGGDMPYEDDSGGKLDIPDEQNTQKLLTAQAPSSSQSQSGMGIGDALALAKFAMMFASGGRTGYANTGAVSDDNLPTYLDALGKIESGGNYGALGPTTKKGDRAYGKYQVMGSNVGPWTQEALGKAMTPDDFLADKNAQEAVAKHYFGQALSKYGSPQDAASVWFTGKPLAKTTQQTADITGMTVPKYLQRFNKAAGLGQVAGLDQIGGGDDTQQPAWFHPEIADSYKSLPGSSQYAEAELPTATKQVGGTEEDTPAGGLVPSEGYEAAKKSLNPPNVWSDIGKGLGVPDKYQDSNLWIPALAGLGSMLSSRSPYLLPAIGEGLVGGAAAYTGLQPQQAQTERTRAETMAVLENIPQEDFLRTGDVVVAGPNGEKMVMGAREYAIRILTNPGSVVPWSMRGRKTSGAQGLAGAASAAESATGAGGGTYVPDENDPMALDPSEQKAAQDEVVSLNAKYNGDVTALDKTTPNLKTAYRQQALDAGQQQKNNIIYADLLHSRDPLFQGTYADWANSILTKINYARSVANMAPINQDQAANIEELTKLYNQTVQSAPRGSETASELDALGKTYPFLTNTNYGAAKNMANIIPSTQTAIDRNQLAQNLRKSSGGIGKYMPEGDYIGENFASQFNAKSLPLQAKESAILEQMMTEQAADEHGDPFIDPKTGKPLSWFSLLARYGGRAPDLAKSIAARFKDPYLLRLFPNVKPNYGTGN